MNLKRTAITCACLTLFTACTPDASLLESLKPSVAHVDSTLSSEQPIPPFTPPAYPVLSNPSQLLIERAFTSEEKRWVPADFQTVKLELTFDVPSGIARGHAFVKFRTLEKGYPYFLMTPAAGAVRVRGAPVELKSIKDPDNVTQLKAINLEVLPGETQELEIEYVLPASKYTIENSGARFLSSMADIAKGNYWEAYGPANFEADQFQMTLDLRIVGGTSGHRVFTNGTTQALGAQHWRIEFPEHFTSSSFFAHLSNDAFTVREKVYMGLEKAIPIQIYSKDAKLADEAFANVAAYMTELESTYGPYLHSGFTAYISGSGGMEFSGATITSVSALSHELTHSWFARGVMPSDGRSGWIDEAIARWRGNGYPRATQVTWREPVNLADFSMFNPFAPKTSYALGSLLLSEIDALSSERGGLRPALARFFSSWKGQVISTEIFRIFLEADLRIPLKSMFERYAYGKSDTKARGRAPSLEDHSVDGHPPALTEAEIKALR